MVFMTIVIMGSFIPVKQEAHAASSTILLYVALNGSDSNSGSITAPFRTLERARQEIRTIKSSSSGLPVGGITVYIREGVYKQTSSFALSAEDSGTASSPILYKAYNNENVRFTGGADLNPAAFVTVTDPSILNWLPTEARGQVLQVNLASQGITDYGQIEVSGMGINTIPAPPELFL